MKKVIVSSKKQIRSTAYPCWYDDELKAKYKNKIKSGTSTSGMMTKIESYNDPEPPLEPREIEYEKMNDEEELIYKVLKDVIISVSDDGEIEFEDTEWAKPDESEEEGVGDSYFAHNLWDLFDFGFVTTEDVIYDAKKLITAYVPYKSGKYKINGELNMTYNLSNLLVYNSDTTSTIEYVDKDAIEVDFNLSNSYVENFDYEEI